MNSASISLAEPGDNPRLHQATTLNPNMQTLPPAGDESDRAGLGKKQQEGPTYGFKELKRQYDEEMSEDRKIEALQKVRAPYADQQ